MRFFGHKHNFFPAQRLLPLLGLLIICTCGFDGGCLGFGGSPPIFVHVQDVTFVDGKLTKATRRPFQPVYGSWQYDQPSNEGGNSPYGSVKEFGFQSAAFTNSMGDYQQENARINAYWKFGVEFEPACNTTNPPASVTFYQGPTTLMSDALHDESILCEYIIGDPPGTPLPGFPFFQSSAPPSSVTFNSQSDLSMYSPSAVGAYIWDRNGQVVQTLSATNVSGTTATFPPPSVAPDMYSVGLVATHSDGSLHYLGNDGLSIGNTIMNLPRAFGVDGAYIATTETTCSTPDPYGDGTYAGQTTCYSQNSDGRYAVVSLFDSNQISAGGTLINVGKKPTTILTYGNYFTPYYQGDEHNYYEKDTQGVSSALVINSGENTVSFVDLPSTSVQATVSLSNRPTSAAISVSAQCAFVTTDDGYVTRIDLNNYSNTGSVYVGPHPSSVSIRASGDVLVGGQGFVSILGANSLTISNTDPSINGLVTGLAEGSSQQIYLSIFSTGNGLNLTIQKRSANLSGAMQIASMDASTYAASASSSGLINSALMASGAKSGLGGSFIVFTTPSGFLTVEGSSGNIVNMGSVQGVVRAIGTNDVNNAAYLSNPDNNSVIEIPLPSLPVLNPNSQIAG